MLATLRDRTRPFFAEAAPAHDWHHVERVDRLAVRLADDHPEPVDRTVLRAAVYCHDVGREREARGEIDDHAAWGAQRVPDLLDGLADERTVERVAHCVRAHRYSGSVDPTSLEAELLCDADNLDAIGAVGVGRTFAHGGTLGEPMHGSDDPRSGGQLAHVHGKLLRLKGRMYTDPGRELAADRHAVVERFIEQFEAELAGER